VANTAVLRPNWQKFVKSSFQKTSKKVKIDLIKNLIINVLFTIKKFQEIFEKIFLQRTRAALGRTWEGLRKVLRRFVVSFINWPQQKKTDYPRCLWVENAVSKGGGGQMYTHTFPPLSSSWFGAELCMSFTGFH